MQCQQKPFECLNLGRAVKISLLFSDGMPTAALTVVGRCEMYQKEPCIESVRIMIRRSPPRKVKLQISI